MKVFKFGGASLRHAVAIRKVSGIISREKGEQIIIVVSAMGKTTNALERVVYDSLSGKDIQQEIEALLEYHHSVMRELFAPNHPVWKKISIEFINLQEELQKHTEPNQLYDQIVSTGEILSSIIVYEYLLGQSFPIQWIDARHYIMTDDTFREGKVNWNLTSTRCSGLFSKLENGLIITQGFIGAAPNGMTTTLGREGSDYTAAIFASSMNAHSVTIWKDVPGVMNADPKRLHSAIVFEELPFSEAAEMTYYGASVIHPKTIKPLANKNIPLLVKNFDDPDLPGTVIRETKVFQLPPLIVFKDDQCLVSCRVTDYTFIDEQQLSFIFQALSEQNIKINVMQNSAISFSFCIDFREDKVLKLIEVLAKQFDVYYNTGLTLITIKNYDVALSEHYRKQPGVILEQSSRSTLQVLMKN